MGSQTTFDPRKCQATSTASSTVVASTSGTELARLAFGVDAAKPKPLASSTSTKRLAVTHNESQRALMASGHHAATHAEFVDFIGAERISTWGMLYCGGSQPVVDALEEVQRNCGIELKVEKFDW